MMNAATVFLPALLRALIAGGGCAILGCVALASQAAAQTAPTGTSNFAIGTVPDGHGRIPVTADWTTPLSGSGDWFSATGAPVAVTIGPNANIYAQTDNGTNPLPGPAATVILPAGSLLNNYGVLNNFPTTFPSFNVNGQYTMTNPEISVQSNNIINNYGTMGLNTQTEEVTHNNVYVPNNTSGIVVNNYHYMVADTPVQADAATATVRNYAGAKIVANFGSPMRGFISGYNYQDAGLLNTKTNGSYCGHIGIGASQWNWGYCIATGIGYWMDQGNHALYDYGGPLVASSFDFNGNIVFNGTVSSTFTEDPTKDQHPCSSVNIASVIGVNKTALNFFSTTYTLSSNASQQVTYLPQIFGFPIQNTGTGGSAGAINFFFTGLTQAQQDVIQAAVASAKPPIANGVSAGIYSFAVDGQTYSFCSCASVTATFSNTIVGKGLNGNPLPGVHYAQGGQAAYYVDPDDEVENPYYLVNAATVRLTEGQALQPGQTVIQPGWTLLVGATIQSLVGETITNTNMDDDFSTAPGGGDSILLETAQARTPGNVDGVLGKTATLSAALVINNPTQAVTLPNLLGGGSLMQEGLATTTLAGTANTVTGPLYLGAGTLKIAAGANFSVPPNLVVGTNDARQVDPVFDVSALGTGKTFTLSSLTTAGPQIQIFTNNFSSGLYYPTISLGGTSLMVGTGKHKNSSAFLGGLTGTGGLVVASQTTLDLGGVATMNAVGFQPTKLVPISTFSGGTTVAQGGTLILENRGALGAGALQNAGTVQLGSGTQFLPYLNNLMQPTSDAAPNHVVKAPAAYTQTATGALVLRVHGDDGAGTAGSGAGIAYEQLSAVGKVSLAGTLTLKLVAGYVPPAGGATLSVVSAPAGLTGQFTTVQVVGGAAKVAAQHVTSNGVTVTLMPAGG